MILPGFSAVDDKAYKSALRRRDDLLKELELIEEFIRLYEQLFANEADSQSRGFQRSEPRLRERNLLPPHRLAAMAEEIIRDQRRPMTRSELASAIEARGIPLKGVDRTKNLGTILWRNRDKFANIPGWGYWIRELPYPEAGYTPTAPD
jgi:hypothetical protein